MDTFGHIMNGFNVALMPINLWYTFLGCFMGTIIGILPGIGPAAGIGLLIPITFGMDPTSALIMMAGIYYGAMYGGSTTSILINTPGEASSVMTALDGYQMAKNGRAGAALAVAAIGSFIAGTLGIIALTLLAVPLAAVALKFGPAEYFCLMVFALAAVSSLTGKSAAKGLMSTVLGLMIATIGIDLQSGQPRYTMGVPDIARDRAAHRDRHAVRRNAYGGRRRCEACALVARGPPPSAADRRRDALDRAVFLDVRQRRLPCFHRNIFARDDGGIQPRQVDRQYADCGTVCDRQLSAVRQSAGCGAAHRHFEFLGKTLWILSATSCTASTSH